MAAKKKTKKKKLPTLPALRRKALKLWSIQVRALNHNRCMMCGDKHKMLNAHHLEDKKLYGLRFDVLNGAPLCPLCHKFGKDAAHRSIFFYEFFKAKRPKVLEYLRVARDNPKIDDREGLNRLIEDLSGPLKQEWKDMVDYEEEDEESTDFEESDSSSSSGE
jgi:hypothetical protein